MQSKAIKDQGEKQLDGIETLKKNQLKMIKCTRKKE